MFVFLRKILIKYWDILSYLFFGVLTTVVNYAVYLPCYNLLGFSASASNLIAWVVAVAFAYLTNKPFVFKSNDWSVKTVIPELAKFAEVDFTFMFSWLDLAKIPTLGTAYPDPLMIIPILSGLTSWLSGWVTRLGQPKPKDPSQQKGKMMTIMMPFMSAWIAFMVPAGLGLYWILSNLFSAAQEPILTKYYKNKLSNNTIQEAQR